MAKEQTQEQGRIWNIIDRLEGDKVIWMIVLLLMLISIVVVFTSTPLLVEVGKTRFDILADHLKIVGLGLVLIIIIYAIKEIKIFKFLSQFGFLLSFVLLLFLFLKIGYGSEMPIRAQYINNAWRTIYFYGQQIHVFEIVKVAMVMYLAWAIDTFKDDNFTLVNHLAAKYEKLKWLEKPIAKKSIYIYIPLLVTCVLMLNGGGSATAMFAMMMIIIMFVGGVNVIEIIGFILLIGLYVGLAIGVDKATGGKIQLAGRLSHVSGETRGGKSIKLMKEYEALTTDKARDDFRKQTLFEQPASALLAIKEGGVLGKGIGRSTQKYVVPIMYGDYVFSFIVEETGWWGAFFIIMLYISLLARGSRVAKNCDDYFAKSAMAGLIIMITIQAFLHMGVNVQILPQTGQTLPMISHGASSFLCFCVAFGIILSISRMAKGKMLKDARMAAPIVEDEDEIQDGLNDLDSLESEEL